MKDLNTVRDGRDLRLQPCAQLPELVLIGRTEIQQPLPKLDVPFDPGCLNLYLGYKGSKQMQAQGRTWTLTAGECFMTPPGVDHATGPMPVSRCAHYWLRVDVSLSEPFLGSAEHEPLREALRELGIVHGRFSEALFAGVRGIYGTCASSSGQMESLRVVDVRCQLVLVLLRLVELAYAQPADLESDPRMQVLLDHIDRHLGEDLSVQDLAAMAGCSVSAVQALFKRHQGLSPGEYIIRCRMRAAEQILLASDLPLRAIAERLGFADERHFSTAFRRYHGEPPGRFRTQRLS